MAKKKQPPETYSPPPGPGAAPFDVFEDPDGPHWHVEPDGTAYALGLFQGQPNQVSMVDYAYAIDPTMAAFLVSAAVNGKMIRLSQKLPAGAKIQWFIARDAQPQEAWLKFVTSPAREIIMHQLGIPMTAYDEAVYRAAMRERAQPDKPKFPNAAVTEATARQSYVQPGREGKRLIGAYVPIPDAARFQAALKARGTNVQEFFSQVVTNELAILDDPAARERLAQAQLERFRATLRPLAKP